MDQLRKRSVRRDGDNQCGLNLNEHAQIPAQHPRNFVSVKIRRFLEIAEEHGFKWAWADTCCIDKTSSAELSEAINSMFSYYSLALICFVYLGDVPTVNPLAPFAIPKQSNRGVDVSYSYFGRSRWHTRGWTLQELIASRSLWFFSESWDILGTKLEFTKELHDITHIPEDVLLDITSCTGMSVARRMSWAAERETTRVEDRAYSLLGIFDINIPTMYGEGLNAFQRLQAAILQKTPDTTLFAWGYGYDAWPHKIDGSWVYKPPLNPDRPMNNMLLADIPYQFKDSHDIDYRPDSESSRTAEKSATKQRLSLSTLPRSATKLVKVSYHITVIRLFKSWLNHGQRWVLNTDVDLISFNITPYGIEAHLPIVEYENNTYADLSWFIRDRKLLLSVSKEAGDKLANHSLPLYSVSPVRRIVTLYPADNDAIMYGNKAEFKRVFFELSTSHKKIPLYLPLNYIPFPVIRIPEHQLVCLATEIHAAISVKNGKSMECPTTISFMHHFSPSVTGPCTLLSFGTCKQNSRSGDMSVWVNMEMVESDEDPDCKHSCTDDHILNWPEHERTVTFRRYDQFTYTILLAYTTSSSGMHTLSLSLVKY